MFVEKCLYMMVIYNKDKQSMNRARIVRKTCEKIQEVLEI